MQKILLYYAFAPLADPQAIKMWQKALCERLNLHGRILISSKGLNGTVGGDIEALKTYAKETKSYGPFKGIDFKWSDGSRDDFPKLSIKVRSETVTLGIPDEVEVDEHGVVGGGERIRPEELDQFVADNPDAIFFDGRNNYESAIGKFKNAITPDVRTFKEFPSELEKPEYTSLKDKKIITYCTGGIRCETLSALMKKKGFSQVYQLHGGIVKYGEAKKDDGLWEGKCYVFDARNSVAFSDTSVDIAACAFCGVKTSGYMNCDNAVCNKMLLACEQCKQMRKECGQCILESPKITTA